MMVRIALLLTAFLTAQACVSVRQNHGYSLERGQTELTGEAGLDSKESMLAKYGEPSMIGTFNPNVWYYLAAQNTTRAFFKTRTKARTVVAIHFDDEGVLTEVENFTLEDGDNVKLVARATRTRGKELNFWEQLLGNVGQLPGGLGQERPTPGQ